MQFEKSSEVQSMTAEPRVQFASGQKPTLERGVCIAYRVRGIAVENK